MCGKLSGIIRLNLLYRNLEVVRTKHYVFAGRCSLGGISFTVGGMEGSADSRMGMLDEI